LMEIFHGIVGRTRSRKNCGSYLTNPEYTLQQMKTVFHEEGIVVVNENGGNANREIPCTR